MSGKSPKSLMIVKKTFQWLMEYSKKHGRSGWGLHSPAPKRELLVRKNIVAPRNAPDIPEKPRDTSEDLDDSWLTDEERKKIKKEQSKDEPYVHMVNEAMGETDIDEQLPEIYKTPMPRLSRKKKVRRPISHLPNRLTPAQSVNLFDLYKRDPINNSWEKLATKYGLDADEYQTILDNYSAPVLYFVQGEDDLPEIEGDWSLPAQSERIPKSQTGLYTDYLLHTFDDQERRKRDMQKKREASKKSPKKK